MEELKERELLNQMKTPYEDHIYNIENRAILGFEAKGAYFWKDADCIKRGLPENLVKFKTGVSSNIIARRKKYKKHL